MLSREKIHQEFVLALPRIEKHAEIVFRSVRCPHRKADLISETVALAFKWWLRLRRRGKNPNRFVSAIATFAARAAGSGRRVCGQEKAKDVLSPRAQQLHHFTVGTLPAFSTLATNPLSEALIHNTMTPVDEQVAFRFDFPAWMTTYDQRRRDIIAGMASGERTTDLAERFRISPARISQMRLEFFLSWESFGADEQA
jgi:hypothetical protein